MRPRRRAFKPAYYPDGERVVHHHHHHHRQNPVNSRASLLGQRSLDPRFARAKERRRKRRRRKKRVEARRKSAFVNASRENLKRHGSSTNDKFTASVSVRDIPVWPGAIGPDLEQTKSSWQSARFEHGSFLRAARQAECVRVYGRLLRRLCVRLRFVHGSSTDPSDINFPEPFN